MTDSIISSPNGNYVEAAVTINPDYGTLWDLKISKTGRVVNLFGRFDLSTQAPAYANLLTLPDGFYGSPTSIFAFKFNGTGILYWMYGGKTVSVQSQPIPAGTYYVNMSWIIK